MTELKRNEKLDIVELLKDLDKYEPRRRGWVWRERADEGVFRAGGDLTGETYKAGCQIRRNEAVSYKNNMKSE